MRLNEQEVEQIQIARKALERAKMSLTSRLLKQHFGGAIKVKLNEQDEALLPPQWWHFLLR